MIYYIAYFFVNSTFVIINPYLQVVINNLGYDVKYVGAFLAIFEAAGIAGPLVLGNIADKKCLFKVLTSISLVLTSIAFYSLSFPLPLFLVIIALLVTGIFFRTVAPLFDAMTTILIKGDSQRYAKYRSFGTLGYVIVSTVLSIFKRPIIDDNSNIGFYFILICFASLICVILYPKVSINPKEITTEKNISDNKKWYSLALILGLILMSLSRFSMSAVYSFFSLYSIKVVHYDNITLLNAVGALCEFVIIIACGYLLKNKKISPYSLIMIGTLGVVIRFSLYILFPSVVGVMVAQLFHGLCYGAFHIGSISFITENVSEERRGLGISLYFALATGMPAVFGSLIGGFIVSNYGFNSLFFIYGLISFIAFLLGFVFKYIIERNNKQII